MKKDMHLRPNFNMTFPNLILDNMIYDESICFFYLYTRFIPGGTPILEVIPGLLLTKAKPKLQ